MMMTVDVDVGVVGFNNNARRERRKSSHPPNSTSAPACTPTAPNLKKVLKYPTWEGLGENLVLQSIAGRQAVEKNLYETKTSPQEFDEDDCYHST
jgi:hypothetical protein